MTTTMCQIKGYAWHSNGEARTSCHTLPVNCEHTCSIKRAEHRHLEYGGGGGNNTSSNNTGGYFKIREHFYRAISMGDKASTTAGTITLFGCTATMALARIRLRMPSLRWYHGGLSNTSTLRCPTINAWLVPSGMRSCFLMGYCHRIGSDRTTCS